MNKKNPNARTEVIEHNRKNIQTYGETMLDEMPAFLGFSARLNMLWDLTGIVPSLNDGRVLAVLAINKSWRENEVRGWLEMVLNEGVFPHTNAGNLSKDEMRELQKTNVSMGLIDRKSVV